MKDVSVIEIFKAAFNVEVENKVEIVDNKILIYTKENKVITVEINKMFAI